VTLLLGNASNAAVDVITSSISTIVDRTFFFHNKETSKCKINVKNFCLLANSEVFRACCGRYKSFGINAMSNGSSSLLDCADSDDGGRVPFRSVGGYLPIDTASYSGGFISTNFRI
jgi:hypothetical protein